MELDWSLRFAPSVTKPPEHVVDTHLSKVLDQSEPELKDQSVALELVVVPNLELNIVPKPSIVPSKEI